MISLTVARDVVTSDVSDRCCRLRLAEVGDRRGLVVGFEVSIGSFVGDAEAVDVADAVDVFAVVDVVDVVDEFDFFDVTPDRSTVVKGTNGLSLDSLVARCGTILLPLASTAVSFAKISISNRSFDKSDASFCKIALAINAFVAFDLSSIVFAISSHS